MRNTSVLLSILAISAASAALAQQPPPGADISTAIPIWFGQFVNGIGDSGTNPRVVYSIPLAKGEQISATMTVPASAPSPAMQLILFSPSTTTVAGAGYSTGSQGVADSGRSSRSATYSYLVPADGTYYVVAAFASESVSYTLQVSTRGTPQLQTLPTQAGCLTGEVDYITYSLDLIALNLPDQISIGGTASCASGCTIQAPMYSQITEKLEKAMAFNLPVQACYDANGNIFQVQLQNTYYVPGTNRSAARRTR
jgi:hypothetical protein